VNWREDKTLLTLGFFTVFFAVVVLLLIWLRNDDGQSYQTYAGLLTGFAGALMMHLKGEKVPPAGSTTDFHQVTQVPPVLPPDPPKDPTL
jgi:hypothetical protein